MESQLRQQRVQLDESIPARGKFKRDGPAKCRDFDLSTQSLCFGHGSLEVLIACEEYAHIVVSIERLNEELRGKTDIEALLDEACAAPPKRERLDLIPDGAEASKEIELGLAGSRGK